MKPNILPSAFRVTVAFTNNVSSPIATLFRRSRQNPYLLPAFEFAITTSPVATFFVGLGGIFCSCITAAASFLYSLKCKLGYVEPPPNILWPHRVPWKWLSLVAQVWWRNGSGKKLCFKSKKRKKSEGKMLYHCNLICVSLKHGMHGSLQGFKIWYIHNCWNQYFCPRTVVKLR